MKAILDPTRILQGQDLSWLKDLKDTASYKEIARDSKGVTVSIDVEDVERIIALKNSLQGTTYTFWGIVEDMNKNGQSVSPYVGIWDLSMWIYADVSLLSTEIPEGLPNRLQEDGITVNTFEEWLNTWSSSFRYSLDNTKVIIPTNARNSFLSIAEMNVIIDFIAGDWLTLAELCNVKRVKELYNSVEFYSEIDL